jgi:hypothetical protein
MKLIKPFEISAHILSLLDESAERLILISPYMRISRWFKFVNKLYEVKSRGIPIEIYVRDDPDNTATYRDLNQLELAYKKIPHLHSKLYLNEMDGIVTSLNLLLSSEINSLEIGYATETWLEYNELLDYYHRYIHADEAIHTDTIAGQPAADLKEIMQNIREEIKRTAKNSRLWFAGNAQHIHVGRSNYRVSINDRYLRISVRMKIASEFLRDMMQNDSMIRKKIEDLTAMKIDIHPVAKQGQQAGTLQVSGQAKQTLLSTSMNGILKAEAAHLIETVTRFIKATGDWALQDLL